MLRYGWFGLVLSLGAFWACDNVDAPEQPVTLVEQQQDLSLADIKEAAKLLGGSVDSYKDAVTKLFELLQRSGMFAKDNGKYFFKVEDLEEIAKLGIGKPTREMFDTVHRELLRRYPGKIAESYRFIINDAGGALGQVAILYASLNEYLIFFGSPLSNNGHSGRYNAEFWDIMMDGEMNTFIEGEVERTVYLPGQTAYLPKGQAKVYQLVDHGWMLEYSRGPMIELFPFGVIAPAMFVTLDWESAWKQISDFGKLAIKNILNP